MRIRILTRVVSIVTIATLSTAAVSRAASTEEKPARTVLVLHWGAEDFPGTPVLDAAIRESLGSRPDAPINYFAEYLESEAFPASSPALREYIRQKYAARRVDLVIANTTPSLDFALANRQELFPNVPIVFLAGSMPRAIAERSSSGITGIVSDVSFAETLELGLNLHPGARRVFVVAQAPTVETYRERVRAALGRLSERVEISYINETSVARLLSAIKTIPAGSLILYTRFTPENADRATDTVNVARLMAQVSPVPIYGPTALYLGTGVVGGMMRDSRNTGARLGAIAHQILEGTRPDDIPVETIQRVPTFDWRQVQRWGIDAARLPPGSDIQFRTPTIWESYRGVIAATVIVIVTQAVLIAGLLTERTRRHRAERTVVTREATLRSSYERIRQLAGRLMTAQEAVRSDIARDLHDDVCQRLVSVSIAVNSLKASSGQIQATPTQQALSNLEQDIGEVFDGIRRLSHELHSATLRLLGLTPALKAHCKEVEKRHDVRVTFSADPDIGQLHPDVALCFFRIAQESLRNGIVHGHAQRLTVSLSKSGEYLELTVSDDGGGFDVETVRKTGGGLGLVSMEERTHLIGGEVQIVSAPRLGTTVYVRAPAAPPQPSHVTDPDVPAEVPSDHRFPAAS